VWSIGGMIPVQAVEADVPGWREEEEEEGWGLSQCHIVHHKSHTD